MSLKGSEELNEIKRISKSFEAIQQSAIIALLNSVGFSFEFRKPERMALKTTQYIYVQQVFYLDQKLDFENPIDKFCEDQLAVELSDANPSACKKTLKRRRDLNRAALSFNWLVNFLQSVGYTVSVRPTKSSKKTLQMMKVIEVKYGNDVVLNKETINYVGKEINKYILSLFSKNERKMGLERFDKKCNELMMGVINSNASQLTTTQGVPCQNSVNIDIEYTNNEQIMNENGFIQNVYY